MSGDLVLPSSPGYLTDAESYNPVFDGARPKGIAYVASNTDVAAVVAFGRDHGIPLSIRSGGHCYGGWSTGSGLVIDVSKLSAVTVSPASASAGPTVAVGTGTRLIDLYAGCAAHDVAVPGGSCPTVGVAGLTLGGGLGVVDRKFGLTCDNLIGADVVLASGEIVTADATTNSDLFWGLRGGGGGNFGVATQLRFGAHSIAGTSFGLFTLVWPWSAAARVAAAWQSWAPHAPDELWSNCLLIASQSTPSGESPVARVTGVYVGSETALEAELQHLLDAVPTAPFTHFVGTAGYLDTMLIEAGCDGDSVAACHLPTADPAGILTREPFVARSDIVTSPVSSAGIAAMMAAVEARQASPVLSGGGLVLDASGGAINRVPATATAYVHRDALFTIQYSGGWSVGASSEVVTANHTWIAGAWHSMRPYVSGQAYQNYIDPTLATWKTAYYGKNLARLEQVKVHYDPDDVFHFPQSIPVGR